MTYEAPIRDMMFNLDHLSQWPQVSALEKYGEIDRTDARAALEELGRFCTDLIAPLSAVGDTTGAQLDGDKVVLPEAFAAAYAQFVDMGWQSLAHPVDHGGMGLPRVVGAAATEILNAADMSFGLCPLLTDGAIDALQLSGTEAQKELYLRPLVSGRWTGTMNLTEPQAGSDLGRVRCKAEPRADGSYGVSGTKIFITYGAHELSENIIHLVLARTPGAPEGHRGLSLFLVPKFLVDQDGTPGDRNSVNCVSIEHKLGVRASPTAVLEYADATGYLIGEENRGLEYMFTMMNAARFAVGVQGVAVSERAYQHALSYAKERVQGQAIGLDPDQTTAIIGHPDVRRMVLRMRALVEGGRSLSMAAAGWLDLSQNGDDDIRAETAPVAEFLVPLVKAFCSERAVEVASLGVQIHGGMGFIEETGVAQFYRDARILPIYEGTTAIQANDLLGRKVLRDTGQTARRFSAMIADTEAALQTGSAKLQDIAACLGEARAAFDTSLSWLLETAANDPRAAFGGSVPFLNLTGTLAAGWQLARAARAAEAEQHRGNETEFMAQKVTTAQIFAHHVLVECESDRARIMTGATSLLDEASQI
ncbi:acyl-CoA dehydrogenase (plasmid) [Phaeobacter piscinae]|uniref:Acyl-CoA dehydrogenase n=1 Tax=Phaeobacter piscinae TaxID=1580596 RepID=A0ABM6PII8_9RHOB|nr:acyl-CoA dehydrogenase [Phaeobacter piscinae]ATG37682.1 acyl-CoA dehydrogenase [Phaeobacter piscinae]AUQ88203.1 acyl-CoA dehydrogenase [Phaeobacter piscinae]AUR26086.1 acyl-CoA dehydrogenase [Phaeobacter piscinae]